MDIHKKIQRLADRLKVDPSAIALDSGTLTLNFHGHCVSRSCTGPEAQENLIHWLSDLVRNIERRIETVGEALYTGETLQLPSGMDNYGDIGLNPYEGTATVADAQAMLQRVLERLGLKMKHVSVKWSSDPNEATLLLSLPSGRIVKKVSSVQSSPLQNLMALTLWLQNRAKNWERGIEPDLDSAFASNLLPAGNP